LCRQLREELQQRTKAFTPLITFDYIGIDPNAQHAASLVRQGEQAAVGIAQNLPLQTNSVDMVIAEEVLDALPYRVCKWRRKSSRIEQEAFVENTGMGLKLRFDAPERDDTINTTEEFLREFNYRNCQYSFSPAYGDFWREILRVLQPHGIAIVSDYTINAWIAHYTKHTMEQHAVAHPYADDLTHRIDGLLQVDVAKSTGFTSVEEIRARKEFAELGGPRAGEAIARAARVVLRAQKEVPQPLAVPNHKA
jgi:SAM-dependent methyltransferase